MKTTFNAAWGWSTLSEWDYDSDRFPTAIKLADGTVISINEQDRLSAEWKAAQRYPRSRATYIQMDADGIVRVRFASSSAPWLPAGSAWARLEVIAPKSATWLYNGWCADCACQMDYSEDAESSVLCPVCQEQHDWQEAQSEIAGQ